MTQEELKMALDLTTMHHTDNGYAALREKVRSAIKEALAQPEQEPVAWADLNALSEQINSVNCGTVYRLPSKEENRQPLYTTPPQRTEQEPLFKKIIDQHPGLAEELKAMDATEQEPVGRFTGKFTVDAHDRMLCEVVCMGAIPTAGAALYNTPPQRTWVGLTDDEQRDIAYSDINVWDWGELMDAVEAKLKEKNT